MRLGWWRPQAAATRSFDLKDQGILEVAAMNLIKRTALALSFLVWAPLVVAQVQTAAEISPAAPHIPRTAKTVSRIVSISFWQDSFIVRRGIHVDAGVLLCR